VFVLIKKWASRIRLFSVVDDDIHRRDIFLLAFIKIVILRWMKKNDFRSKAICPQCSSWHTVFNCSEKKKPFVLYRDTKYYSTRTHNKILCISYYYVIVCTWTPIRSTRILPDNYNMYII